MKKALFTLSMTLSSLGVALAQIPGPTVTTQTGQVNTSAISTLLAQAQGIVSALVPFAIGVAVLIFFWFLIKFILNSGDASGRAESLKGMGLSVLALFVMVSIWGIINFIGSVFNIGAGGGIPVPQVPR